MKHLALICLLCSSVGWAASEEVRLDTELGPLFGTLELPADSFGTAVALIIAGSGPTDRDGNSTLLPGKNNSLKYLAEGLLGEGIATLRYDKRLIGESTSDELTEEDLRFDTYVADAELWVDYLRQRFDLPVFLIGHSEGSLIALRPDGTVAWKVALGGAIEGAASIDDDGRIYAGTGRGEIAQVDASGAVRWRFKTGDEVRATPAIARDGTIVVGSYDGNVYAIRSNGSLRWKVPTGGRVRASARIDADGRIYVGSQDNFLYCIDPSGSVLWRYNVGQDVDSTVEIGSDGTLYVGSDDGGVHALR